MKWLLSPSDCTAASQWWLSTSPLSAACSPVVSVQTGKHGALMYLLINNCTTLYYWNNFKDTWLSYTELHGWIHRWKVTCQYKGRDHTFQSVLQVKPAIFVTFQPITFHLSAVMQEVSNVFVGRCPQETECWTTAGVVMFFSPTVIGRLCETTCRQVSFQAKHLVHQQHLPSKPWVPFLLQTISHPLLYWEHVCQFSFFLISTGKYPRKYRIKQKLATEPFTDSCMLECPCWQPGRIHSSYCPNI